MKYFLVFMLATLAVLGQAQGVHVSNQIWSTSVIDQLYSLKLYNQSTNTISIDSFEYTVDPSNPMGYNDWVLNNKINVKNTWQSTHAGISVKILGRATRTRGTATSCMLIPTDPLELAWWGSFVTGKMQIINNSKMYAGETLIMGGWNEQSLQWIPSTTVEITDRPERQAAAIDQLVKQSLAAGLTNFKVLNPTVHGLVDNTVGYGYTYLTRFYNALPIADRPYVAPDFHLYYGYLAPVSGNIITSEYTDLAKSMSFLSGLGYKPSDMYVSEFGCFWYSGTQVPTSAQAATRMKNIYQTAMYAGIPRNHMYAWLDWSGTGPMAALDGTGALTPYGLAVKDFVNGK